MAEYTYLLVFGFALVATIPLFLFLSAFSYPKNTKHTPKRKAKGKCPICGILLYQGQKVRSNRTEIADLAHYTRIKGCLHCYPEGKRKRSCPVCQKEVPIDEHVLAVSEPRKNPLKLMLRGCRNCYPEGF